jgi:hypothetical protein
MATPGSNSSTAVASARPAASRPSASHAAASAGTRAATAFLVGAAPSPDVLDDETVAAQQDEMLDSTSWSRESF